MRRWWARAGRPGLGRDARLLIAGQGVRAAGYGFTAVLLGVLLAARAYTPVVVGVVLTMVGAAAGALGALAVSLTGLHHGRAVTASGWLFAVLIPVGLAGVVIALRLSPAMEAPPGAAGPSSRARTRLGASRSVVRRMAGLFAVDAAGGGLVTTGFLSYYFSERYHVPVAALGWLFFSVSAVQAVSVALAPLLARRFGLVATMVGTHLPSNVLLAAVAFAPGFPAAAALLLARTTLSQMDVPTRQALVMTAVSPEERTAAAATTNAARYTVRPLGPLVAGAVQQVALGAPLVVGGTVKAGYDMALWAWARHLPLGERGQGRWVGGSVGSGPADRPAAGDSPEARQPPPRTAGTAANAARAARGAADHGG